MTIINGNLKGHLLILIFDPENIILKSYGNLIH